MSKKYEITITFLPDPKTGEKSELKYMKLKTKPITEERAFKLGETEARKVWPYYKLHLISYRTKELTK